MAIIKTIAALSQTPDLNGPDGSVDPPSSLDDQERYLGSFIAQLRDGVGYSVGAAIAALGFTPVQQGGGTNMATNKVYLGWNGTTSRLIVQVDNTTFSGVLPSDIDGTARGLRSAGALGGAEIQLNWSDPGGVPAYLYGGNSASAGMVTPPSRLNVNYANSAGSAPANGGNANSVGGVSGWSYSNQNKNPAYLWSTDGSTASQFLVTPGNLSVGYANSAGSAPANGGTSSNSNALGGQGAGYYVNNANSAVQSLRNNATIQMIAAVGGIGDMYWGANVSDERLKKDIADTQANSLRQIERMHFVRYRFRDDLDFKIDSNPGREWPVGILAGEAAEIEPCWITQPGTWKQPDQYAMLMSAMHAIQQLNQQVKVLSAAIHMLTGNS
jgi:hypothetical protein